MSEPIGSLTDGGLVWVGVDYGAKRSVAVFMERNADGSWTVHEEVMGKGLDQLREGTPAEQKSGGQPSEESGGAVSFSDEPPKS
ncbi:MAG: hypothetical protein IOB84_13595 [Brevundimonas sp.]|nr:hypothetical protein [Brevundimonas sp.]